MVGSIYSITIHEWVYIGQTRQVFPKRKSSHLNLLKKKKHPNTILQALYDRYGCNSLKFRIVAEVPVAELCEWEQAYLDQVPEGDRVNIARIQEPPFTNRKHSPETKAKMGRKGKSHHFFQKQFTPEHKAKLSETRMGAKNHFYGKKHQPGSFAHRIKSYTLKSPEGEIITFTGLRQFARSNNLNHSHLIAVAEGRRKSHHGWTKP